MKVEGSHTIKAAGVTRAQLFQLLIDPEVLRRCVPGCELLEAKEDGSYKLILKAGVGAIKGTFTGTIKLDELRAPEHYKMIVDGKGAVGFVKGTGVLDLSEAAEGTTIKYTGDVSVGGTIASVGQRMIQSSAKMMAGQFFTAIEAEAQAVAQAVEADAPVEPPQHGFFRNALRWLSGLLRNWFGARERP